MKLDMIAFSDGSNQFATSCVYLISTNTETKQVFTSMLVSNSKIADETKNSKSLLTIPSKETHGTLLAVSSLMNISKIIIESGFKFPTFISA